MREKVIPPLSVQRTLTRTRGLTVEKVTLLFTWQGGPYVDVYKSEPHGRLRLGHAVTQSTPSEVINVWDADANAPDIPFEVGALRRRVDQWVRSYGKSRLIHDVLHNWSV